MWDLIVSVPDHCLSFYFKQSTPRLQECICKLFNIILSNEKYPSQWRENLLKPIHKKGN